MKFTFRHTSKQLLLHWLSGAASVDALRVSPSALLTSEFELEEPVAEICTRDVIYGLTSLSASTARFGCVRARLRLRRPLEAQLVRFFLPCVAAVLLGVASVFISRTQLLLRFFILSVSTFIVNIKSKSVSSTATLSAADQFILITALTLSILFLEFFIVAWLEWRVCKYLELARGGDGVRETSRTRKQRSVSRKAMHLNGSLPSKSPHSRPHSREGTPRLQWASATALTTSVTDVEGAGGGASFGRLLTTAWKNKSDSRSLVAARIDLTTRALLPVAFCVAVGLYFFFHLFVYATK